MKKIILLIVFALVIMVSCNRESLKISEKEYFEQEDKGIVEENEMMYILNINSWKIHYSTCGTAKRINDENRADYYGDIEDLLNEGYTTCKNCFRE